jgi:hypothetical protein
MSGAFIIFLQLRFWAAAFTPRPVGILVLANYICFSFLKSKNRIYRRARVMVRAFGQGDSHPLDLHVADHFGHHRNDAPDRGQHDDAPEYFPGEKCRITCFMISRLVPQFVFPIPRRSFQCF